MSNNIALLIASLSTHATNMGAFLLSLCFVARHIKQIILIKINDQD